MKVIAAIEDPAVIKRILVHLDNRQGAGQHPEHHLNSYCPVCWSKAAGSPTRTDARPEAASA